MKRFIILVLAFFALVVLKAEEKTEGTQVCKCKEGEENCPCLAQSEDKRDIHMRHPGMVEMARKPVHPIKKLIIKRKIHIKKAQVLKAKMARTAAKVAKLHRIAEHAPPHIKRIVLRKKAMAVRHLRQLRRALRKTRIQIHVLKQKIHSAPIALRPSLVAQRTVFRNKCAELLKEIATAQARVKAMKEKFRFYCIERLKHKAILAVKIHKQMKLKLIRIKLAISRVKLHLKVADPEHARVLIHKLRVLKVKYRRLKKTEKTARKTAMVLKRKVQKMEIKIQIKKVAALKKKTKMLRKKITKLALKIKVVHEKIASLKIAIQQVPAKSPLAFRFKAKLVKFYKKVKFMQVTYTTLQASLKPLKAAVAIQIKQVMLTKKLMKKTIRTDRCTLLQKKLQHELALAKELREKFALECKKVAKTATAENLSKLQIIQTRIQKIHHKIEITKAKISKAPVVFKEGLVTKLTILKDKMVRAKRKLRFVITKLETLKTRARVAEGLERVKLAAVQSHLEAKLEAKKHKLDVFVHKYTVLKARYDRECDARLQRERSITHAYMTELEAKLRLLGGEAGKYKELITIAKQEAEAKAHLEALRHSLLSQRNLAMKKKIEAKIMAAQQKVAQIKSVRIQYTLTAKKLRKAYEQKTQALLVKERNAALAKQKALKAKMVLILRKKEAIRKAMIAAHDINIKTALARQQAIEKRKLKLLRKKIALAKAKSQSIKLEMHLRLKAIAAEGKESAIKQALLAKMEKEKLAKLQIEWETDADEDLNLSLKKLRAEYERKMAALKKKLAELVVEKDNYTIHMRFKYKQEKRKRVTSTKKRFDIQITALLNRMTKLKQTFEAYKLKAAKDLAAKEKKMTAKAMAKLKVQIAALKHKLRQERSRQATALRNTILGLKQEYIKEEAQLEQKILTMRSTMAALKAEWMRKIALLRGKLAQETASGDELAISLDSVKAEGAAKKKKYAETQVKAEKEGKAMIASQRKTFSLLISNSRARLAKIQSRFMKTKMTLKAQILKAKQESDILVGRLAFQRKKYNKLQGNYKDLTLKVDLEHRETMRVEKEKTKEQLVEFNQSLKSCDALLQEAKLESKKLRKELAFRITTLKTLRGKKARHLRIAVMINDSEKDFSIHTKNVDILEFQKRKVCDIAGTPGPELRERCKKLQEEINNLKAKDNGFLSKMANLRKQYDLI